MTLESQLAGLRAQAVERIPEDLRRIMMRATREQRESGVLDQTIKVGDALPPFDLTDHTGARVTSQNLLEQGAVVLTVFRGHW